MYTLSEMAAHFERAAMRCHAELEVLVETVAGTAEALAKGYIGKPQDTWEELHQPTIEGFRGDHGFWIRGKRERGFSESLGFEPLRGDTGELKDSIESGAVGLIGIVGSNSKVALWQEMGTPGAKRPIPPRPFLAKAMMEASEGAEEIAGALAVNLLNPST
jgi:hypothetical protein